ncbi:hypothetical protein B5V02_27650 [Mesorhizobium kowhaii]|uniref:Uncharacterized protein n=1 Tax=Mesorhizobium kowhaii TaxID=1300272 RepID=A0A2W7DW10_9HYPH|nr:hypothetical protein B5V02_27650 [Mesorhizobium kowhaii]
MFHAAAKMRTSKHLIFLMKMALLRGMKAAPAVHIEFWDVDPGIAWLAHRYQAAVSPYAREAHPAEVTTTGRNCLS